MTHLRSSPKRLHLIDSRPVGKADLIPGWLSFLISNGNPGVQSMLAHDEITTSSVHCTSLVTQSCPVISVPWLTHSCRRVNLPEVAASLISRHFTLLALSDVVLTSVSLTWRVSQRSLTLKAFNAGKLKLPFSAEQYHSELFYNFQKCIIEK